MTLAPSGGKRIVILASAADAVAVQLPARLGRSDVAVVTPSDLSQPGWLYRPGRRESAIVVEGQVLRSHDIAAVVTRLPWISEVELPHIVASDRAYVAAEMGAFLLAWLSEIDCPVANRPRPNCLCGPFWRHERWVLEAARIGLDVEPVLRRANADGGEYVSRTFARRTSVTVVGDRYVGDADGELGAHALRLARATGVETLTAHFADSGAGMRFFTANPWPPLEDDAAATALLDHLVARGDFP